MLWGLVTLLVARGLFYGLIDDGPYDTSWGGPTLAGAWAAHALISVPSRAGPAGDDRPLQAASRPHCLGGGGTHPAQGVDARWNRLCRSDSLLRGLDESDLSPLGARRRPSPVARRPAA